VGFRQLLCNPRLPEISRADCLPLHCQRRELNREHRAELRSEWGAALLLHNSLDKSRAKSQDRSQAKHQAKHQAKYQDKYQARFRDNFQIASSLDKQAPEDCQGESRPVPHLDSGLTPTASWCRSHRGSSQGNSNRERRDNR
jgi:hypothetical protein